jgi:hypothetical protein
MVLRKYSIYKVKHLVEGGYLYMIYLGNNQFGLGKGCTTESLSSLKRHVLFKKNDPNYVSEWIVPKAFNQYPEKVEVLGLVPLKSIKLTAQTEFNFGNTPSFSLKPKKDYSKMRILNRDA